MGIADRWARTARVVVLAATVSLAHAAAPTPAPPRHTPAQESFASADDAVRALISALRDGDRAALAKILGPGSEHMLSSGDRAADATQVKDFLASYDTKHELVWEAKDRAILEVGQEEWPLPIPVVRDGGAWRFDAAKGAREIVDRRIGRNEIAAIRTCLAFVDAEQAYFDLFKQVTGTGAYAQRLVSTPGNYDGLYWPQAAGIPDSPLQPLVSQAIDEGYPGEIVSGKPMPYHGYFFRVLKVQGNSAPEGAKSYIQGSRMTGGFALLAWPSIYGSSGIMTFEVNRDGVVFQKDLGGDTAAQAAKMMRFDPDLTWTRVDVTAG